MLSGNMTESQTNVWLESALADKDAGSVFSRVDHGDDLGKSRVASTTRPL